MTPKIKTFYRDATPTRGALIEARAEGHKMVRVAYTDVRTPEWNHLNAAATLMEQINGPQPRYHRPEKRQYVGQPIDGDRKWVWIRVDCTTPYFMA